LRSEACFCASFDEAPLTGLATFDPEADPAARLEAFARASLLAEVTAPVGCFILILVAYLLLGYCYDIPAVDD